MSVHLSKVRTQLYNIEKVNKTSVRKLVISSYAQTFKVLVIFKYFIKQIQCIPKIAMQSL